MNAGLQLLGVGSLITIRADNRSANNRTSAGERSPRSLALAICGMLVAGAALAACASQPVVSPFPDLAQTPKPPEAVMTVNQKDAAIEEMQAQAKRNSERAGF